MNRLLGAVLLLLGLSAVAFATTPGADLAATAKVAALLLAVAVVATLSPGWLLSIVGTSLLTPFALVVWFRLRGDPEAYAADGERFDVPLVAIGLVLAAGLVLGLFGPMLERRAPRRPTVPVAALLVAMVLIAAFALGAESAGGAVWLGVVAIAAVVAGVCAVFLPGWPRHLLGGLLLVTGLGIAGWLQATTRGPGWPPLFEGRHLPLINAVAYADRWPALAAASLLLAAGTVLAVGRLAPTGAANATPPPAVVPSGPPVPAALDDFDG